MRKEIIYADRIMSLVCHQRAGEGVMRFFEELVRKFEPQIMQLMNDYRIPQELIVHFRKTNEALDGFFHVQSQIVSKYVIAIEIYTNNWHGFSKSKIKRLNPEKDMLDTFVHELIHYRYYNEWTTRKKTKKIMEQILAGKYKKGK